MQFLSNRFAFFNRRDYDASSFPGKLIAAAPEEPALWLQPPEGAAAPDVAMLYFHGNAATLRSCHPLLRKMRDTFGCHVLAPEFPSYGTSRKTLLTIAGVKRSALAFVRFVVDELEFPVERLVIVSFCMGCSVAFHVAARFPRAMAFVAIAPLATITDYMTSGTRVAAFTHALTPPFWDSLREAPRIFAPTLVVQGTRDRTATVGHVASLFQAVGTANKSLMRYAGEKHIMKWDRAVIPAMCRFFAEAGVDLPRSAAAANAEPRALRSKRGPESRYRALFEPDPRPMWPVLTCHYGIWFAYAVAAILLTYSAVSVMLPDEDGCVTSRPRQHRLGRRVRG